MNSERSPLFIDIKGRAITDIGRYVTNFFVKNTGLHITTTTLREMFETLSKKKFNDGEITDGQRSSVSRLIGHSVKTAENCYVLEDTQSVVQDVANIQFDAIEDDDGSDFDLSQFQGIDYTRVYEHIDWGCEHPDYKNEDTRIKFSDAEKRYVWSLVTRHCKIDPNDSKKYLPPPNFVAFCLEKIKNDSSAIPIFHHRHILNTTRLRSLLRNMRIIK